MTDKHLYKLYGDIITEVNFKSNNIRLAFRLIQKPFKNSVTFL